MTRGQQTSRDVTFFVGTRHPLEARRPNEYPRIPANTRETDTRETMLDGEPRDPIPRAVDVLAAESGGAIHDVALARERARGALLGMALGDAAGAKADGRGERTAQTDLAVLVMRTLAAYFECETDVPEQDFSARVAEWRRSGVAELGGSRGQMAANSITARVLARPEFPEDPLGAAAAVAAEGGPTDAGALARTVACAFTAAPTEWAAVLCEVTHSDVDNMAAAHMLVGLLSALSQIPAGGHIPPLLAVAPIVGGADLISDPARRSGYLRRLTHTTRLEDVSVQGAGAVALWAFRQLVRAPAGGRDAALFRSTIQAITGRAADSAADSAADGAIAGAVLGCALGASQLPRDWLAALPHGDWMSHEIESFLASAEPTWAAP
jgi:ADP-ribosylglycohydrolase